MAVFDGTLYMATYLPEGVADVCNNKARPYIWAVDYFRQATVGSPALGGLGKYPAALSPVRASPLGGVDYSGVAGFTLVPGVNVLQSLACADQSGAPTTDAFGNLNYGASAQNASTFTLAIPLAKGNAGGGLATAPTITLPSPRTPTTIDSWALVTD